MSQLFKAGRQLPSACAANSKAVKGPDVFIYVKKKHDGLGVHDKALNLNKTVYILQILSDLYYAKTFECLVVPSFVDVGL